jgi:hypothetical protein
MAQSKPRRIYGRERLSRLLTVKDTPQALAKATVENINPDGTVDLRLADGVRRNVEVGAWYTPQTGDAVRVFRADPFTLFVMGTVRGPSPTTVVVSNDLLVPYNESVANPSAPAPTTKTGTTQFLATTTRSYRPLDGWSRGEVFQGAYGAGYTYWSGLYFYGTAPQALAGKTVTSATIRIHRTGSGGNISNVAQYIAPHSHLSRPRGAPYFTAGARNLGYVDRNQVLELPVPLGWAQALVDGRATVRGFGHRISATGARYSIAHSKSTDTATGRLTIHWRS